ncbi:hypothetical protein Tco_0408749 [Tanacetum coccineum]
MSEAEPIPPTSSVTALRIPMIKKGEYDLWSMKMRKKRQPLLTHTEHLPTAACLLGYAMHPARSNDA